MKSHVQGNIPGPQMAVLRDKGASRAALILALRCWSVSPEGESFRSSGRFIYLFVFLGPFPAAPLRLGSLRRTPGCVGGVSPAVPCRPVAQHIVSVAPAPSTSHINKCSARAGRACVDSRNYNTNSGAGIYAAAPLGIYDALRQEWAVCACERVCAANASESD